MNISIATLMPYDDNMMHDYLEMWLEACGDNIGGNLSAVEAFAWDDEEHDMCENLHFALPLTENRYWTSFGICERDNNKLILKH